MSIAESIVAEPVVAPEVVATEPVIEVKADEEPVEPVKAEEEKEPKEEKSKDEKDDKKPEDTEEERRKKATWSALAKEERKIEAKRTEFKKEQETTRAAFEAEKESHKKDIESAAYLQKQVAEIKGDFGKLVDIMEKDLDIKLTDFLDYLVKGQSPEYIAKKTEEKMNKRFEEERLNREKEVKELSAKEEARVYDAHKKQISEFLSTNKDEYEWIHLNNYESEVFQLIKLEFDKSQKVLSIKEAADKVENFLDKRIKSAKKLTKAEKEVQELKDSKVSKPIEAKTNEPKKPFYPGLQKRTLNNSNTAPTPTTGKSNAENSQSVSVSGARLVRRTSN